MVVRFRGARQLRQRLVCATLCGKVLRIDDIRSGDQSPGLRDYEANFLRLLEKISNGCVVEINETGTKLRYRPGVLVGGKGLTHDCGTSRAIGYFLEPLVVLGMFGKKPLHINLQGITNDDRDPSVDTFRTATLPMLKRFGVSVEEMELKIVRRGAPPLGGGEVQLRMPMVKELQPVEWTEEGMVKRIRGVAYSTRISPQMSNRMIDAARGIFNALLPDVYIFSDHYSGLESGKSPGYGLSLVAETTSGCVLSAEKAMVRGSGEEQEDAGAAVPAREEESEEEEEEEGEKDVKGGESVQVPEEVGQLAAHLLLQEIRQGGVVDSTHQGLLFLLCALCPEDLCKVRVGPLTPHAIGMLRDVKEILGVQFNIQADRNTGTVILSCVGSGFRNMSRKIS